MYHYTFYNFIVAEKLKSAREVPEPCPIIYSYVYIKLESADYLDDNIEEGEIIFTENFCVLQKDEKLPKTFKVSRDLFISSEKLRGVKSITLIRHATVKVDLQDYAEPNLLRFIENHLISYNPEMNSYERSIPAVTRSLVLRKLPGIERISGSTVNDALTADSTAEFLLICAAAGLDLGRGDVKSTLNMDFNWPEIVQATMDAKEKLQAINEY